MATIDKKIGLVTGATPNLTIGTVTTLEPDASATATITGTAENPVLNLGLPKGQTGEVTEEEFTQLKEDLTSEKNLEEIRWFRTKCDGVYKLFELGDLISGGFINGVTGEFQSGVSDVGLNCCTDFIKVSGKQILMSTVGLLYYSIVFYNQNKQFISSELYYNQYAEINTPTDTEYVRISLSSTAAGYNSNVMFADSGVSSIIQKSVFRNGSVGNTGNATGVCSPFIMPTLGATSVTVFINRPLTSGHYYRFQYTTYSVDHGITQSNGSNRIASDVNVDTFEQVANIPLNDGSIGFAITIYEREGSTAIPLRIADFDFANNVSFIRNYVPNSVNYAINSDFTKTPLSLLKKGTLSANQSFCIYNGHYFSTDGSNLYEQDESFSDISTTTLALGHANAMQLGSNGKAYVSGWDDNKVYVVDLATKTITNTITLPVTGYTTCAVDDINELMYIFHRTTVPSTESIYNFVIYDYANDQIISTKKITVPFGAMQSCDFVNGKILVLNGLGTTAVPNGYRIYNTNGDVISEIKLGTLAMQEPEGCFIDRETGDVYISVLDKSVYKLEQN